MLSTKSTIALKSRAGQTARPSRLTPKATVRRFVGSAGTQIHLMEASASDTSSARLYCLHATAYSGRTFLPFMSVLAGQRSVVALDTPGYGGSDRPKRRLDISEYAERIGKAIANDSMGPVDLLGYHTGALMAAELARQRPELIRRLILVGIPYFEGEDRQYWRALLADPKTLTEDLAQFEERWSYLVANRPPSLNLERAFENFVDELRAYPYGWWAHEAAFTFNVQLCFPNVRQRALVLNPATHLAEASRRAAAALPNATLIELPTLSGGIFDAAPAVLCRLINDFLNED